jgi:hypothetical protein
MTDTTALMSESVDSTLGMISFGKLKIWQRKEGPQQKECDSRQTRTQQKSSMGVDQSSSWILTKIVLSIDEKFQNLFLGFQNYGISRNHKRCSLVEG